MGRIPGEFPAGERDLSGHIFDETGAFRVAQRTFQDIAATGDTQLVPAQGAGKKIRVIGLYERAGAAVSVRLKSAGNNLSASFALGINDDLIFPYCQHGWFETGPNEALNQNQNLAVATGVQVLWIVVE